MASCILCHDGLTCCQRQLQNHAVLQPVKEAVLAVCIGVELVTAGSMMLSSIARSGVPTRQRWPCRSQMASRKDQPEALRRPAGTRGPVVGVQGA